MYSGSDKYSHFTAFARVAPVNILKLTWWSPVKVITITLFPALCTGLFCFVFLSAAVDSVKILVDQLGILPTSNMSEWICHMRWHERIRGLILTQISYLFTLSSALESDYLLWGGVQERFSGVTKFGCAFPPVLHLNTSSCISVRLLYLCFAKRTGADAGPAVSRD